MPRLKVYLGGPLDSHAGDRDLRWRHRAATAFANYGIKAVNPIRGFMSISEEEETLTPAEIVTRDRRDALNSDVILVNFTSAEYPSVGTSAEMAWAHERGIPVVTVWPHERRVPVFAQYLSVRVYGQPGVGGVTHVGGLDDAIEYIADHWGLQ